MSWGKETLRLRLKPIETNSGCTAVCVMIIYTFEDFLLEKGHRGAPLILRAIKGMKSLGLEDKG